MEYQTAKLSPEEVDQLQEIENNLSEATGDNIVVVAYTNEAETRTETERYQP